jgi:sortase A
MRLADLFAMRFLERFAWTTGIVCLTVWSGLLLAGAAGARSDIASFRAAAAQNGGGGGVGGSRPDTSLWSPARIQAWQDSLAREAPAALAVLRIPRLRLEVPVLEGTDDWTLNRGVGHIEGTSKPADAGNVGIAGHRDGFFRGLKDLASCDVLEMEWVAAPSATVSRRSGSSIPMMYRCSIPRPPRR